MNPEPGESLVDLIGQLQDIVEPPAVSMAPQTWGWLVLALVHDPSAHETPASGRIVVGDGRLQVELDLADARVRRNLAGVGGERIARLLAWQERLDAAILPVSASEPTGPQLLRLFGAPPRRRVG